MKKVIVTMYEQKDSLSEERDFWESDVARFEFDDFQNALDFADILVATSSGRIKCEISTVVVSKSYVVKDDE